MKCVCEEVSHDTADDTGHDGGTGTDREDKRV